MAENNVQKAISEIENCLDGKHAVEMNALKNTIFELEKKVAEQEMEIQMKDLKNENLKLENENKLLKLKYETVGTKSSSNNQQPTSLNNDKQMEPPIIDAPKPQKDAKNFFIETDDLLSKGIAKFFFGDDVQAGFYDLYREWFEAMSKRLPRESPFIRERFVLVKLTCKDPAKFYSFDSHIKTVYRENDTQLNILDKGWKHETSTVFILHPNLINGSIQMKECYKCDNFHRWVVDSISKKNIDDEDGSFTILCLKNK